MSFRPAWAKWGDPVLKEQYQINKTEDAFHQEILFLPYLMI